MASLAPGDRVRRYVAHPVGHDDSMVFGGGWGRWPRRRRGMGPFDPYNGDPPPGYGYPPPGYRYGPRRAYGYGGRGSCLRDMLLVEGGCCLAEALGCGPQLVFTTPSLVRSALDTPRRTRGARPSGLRPRVIDTIAFYQREISPKRPACCRFTPTCSHFAVEALERHGLRRGTWLALRRLVRCRPGATGGADPVPR